MTALSFVAFAVLFIAAGGTWGLSLVVGWMDDHEKDPRP